MLLTSPVYSLVLVEFLFNMYMLYFYFDYTVISFYTTLFIVFILSLYYLYKICVTLMWQILLMTVPIFIGAFLYMDLFLKYNKSINQSNLHRLWYELNTEKVHDMLLTCIAVYRSQVFVKCSSIVGLTGSFFFHIFSSLNVA